MNGGGLPGASHSHFIQSSYRSPVFHLAAPTSISFLTSAHPNISFSLFSHPLKKTCTNWSTLPHRSTLLYGSTDCNMSLSFSRHLEFFLSRHLHQGFFLHSDSLAWPRYSSPICFASGVEDKGISSSQYEDFTIVATPLNDSKEIKMSVEVCGAKTQAIFDSVFNQMVADAQPIPGFRRVKGGKTPNIPKDVLLMILGPSRVHKKVIKKIIDSTVSEYVEKESLVVSEELRVEQTCESLEAKFEAGQNLCFDIVLCLDTSK